MTKETPEEKEAREKAEAEKAKQDEERILKLQEAAKAANAAAERLEAALQRQALGGKSEAGIIPEKPKELTPIEFAKAFERGEVKLIG